MSAVTCEEQATRPDGPKRSRPLGCAAFSFLRRCSSVTDRRGYALSWRLGETKNRQQRGMAGYFNKFLGINSMLVQKFLELIGIEIGQHSVACYECRDVSLVGQLFHLFVCLSISADINDIEAITLIGEIFLRVNAPRAPFATVKLQFHGCCRNKQERSAPSIPTASREQFNASPRYRQCLNTTSPKPRGVRSVLP